MGMLQTFACLVTTVLNGLFAPLSAQGGCRVGKWRQVSQGYRADVRTPPPGVTFLTRYILASVADVISMRFCL